MVLICAVEIATSGRPRSLNAQQGAALGTNAVLQRLDVRRVRVVEGVRPVPRGIGAEGKPRMWVYGGGGVGQAGMPKSDSGTIFQRAT